VLIKQSTPGGSRLYPSTRHNNLRHYTINEVPRFLAASQAIALP